MIEFEVWFSQIVTTSELIASEDAFEKTWLKKHPGITSVYDFDELYEQVFDDLDSEALFPEFGLQMDPATRHAVAVFLDAIKRFDHLTIERLSLLEQPIELLSHPEWKLLRVAAGNVISLDSARPYRSGRKDIDLKGERGEADIRLWGDRGGRQSLRDPKRTPGD